MAGLGETILSEVAESLAENLGLTLAESEGLQMIISFVSIEAFKAGLDLVWPSVASGISFSAVGLTLALIRRQLKKIQEKVDLILAGVGLDAKEKFSEALVAFENANMTQAFEDFRSVSDLATSAFNRTQEFEGKITFIKMKIVSLVMFKSFDQELKTFLPFRCLPESRRREIAMNVKQSVEKLIDLLKTISLVGLVGTMKAKMANNKWIKMPESKRKEQIEEILTGVYPLLSYGLGWTNPYNTEINDKADIVTIQLNAKFLPVSNTLLNIEIGSWIGETSGQVHLSVLKRVAEKKVTLEVQGTSFEMDKSGEAQSFALEVFKGKLGAFRDPLALLMSASRIGHLSTISTFIEKSPDFDLNQLNHKQESLLCTAILNKQYTVLKLLLDHGANPGLASRNGNTPLHLAVKSDFVEGVTQLINRNCDVDTLNDQNHSPLSLSIELDKPKMVELMLPLSKKQLKNVILATEFGRLEVVTTMLKMDRSLAHVRREMDQFNLLHIACQNDDYAMAKYILKFKTNSDITNQKNDEGQTPEELARSLGRSKTLQLFKKGIFSFFTGK